MLDTETSTASENRSNGHGTRGNVITLRSVKTTENRPTNRVCNKIQNEKSIVQGILSKNELAEIPSPPIT